MAHMVQVTQTVRSHRSDGDGERSHRYMWHISHRVPQVRCRRTERRLYDELQASSDTQAVGSHKLDGDGLSGPTCRMEMGHWVPQIRWRWRTVPHVHVTRKPSGPTGRMLKDPTSTCRMEKGLSGDFYDELQASRMSNYRSHRYTSDGEGSHRYMSHGNMIEQRLLWWIASITDE
jgi:hypothetical protein